MFFGPTTPHSVVWKKKVGLVSCLWPWQIKFGARKVLWHRKINLLKGLSYQPFFRLIFRAFCSGGELLDGGGAFPVASQAVVDFQKLGGHVILKIRKQIEMDCDWHIKDVSINALGSWVRPGCGTCWRLKCKKIFVLQHWLQEIL